MKIINLAQIWEFIKKNWKYSVLIIAVIAISVRGCIRDGIIKNQAKKIAEQNMTIFTSDNDRKALEIQLKKLQSDNAITQKSNDSMKLILKQKEKALRDMVAQHQAEIQTLLNVPPDTIYKILQGVYPNYSAEEQRFRFGTDQIIPIYKTALELPRIKSEYSLQSQSLSTCMSLGAGYEKSISNLNLQIGNLKENISKADEQVGAYQKKEVILNRQIASNRFWKNTGFVATAVAVVIAIFK